MRCAPRTMLSRWMIDIAKLPILSKSGSSHSRIYTCLWWQQVNSSPVSCFFYYFIVTTIPTILLRAINRFPIFWWIGNLSSCGGCNALSTINVQHSTITCASWFQHGLSSYSQHYLAHNHHHLALTLNPPPYQPHIPASSNCQRYHSMDILLMASLMARRFLVSLLSSIVDSGLHWGFLWQVPLRNWVLQHLHVCGTSRYFAKTSPRDPWEGWGIQAADIWRCEGHEVSAWCYQW